MKAIIARVSRNELVVQDQRDKEMYCNLAPEEGFLFGICLGGIDLRKVYAKGQFVWMFGNNYQGWEAHLGKPIKKPADLYARVEYYCRKHNIDPDTEAELKRRTGVLHHETNTLPSNKGTAERTAPEGNNVAVVGDVQPTFAIITVDRVDMRVEPANVIFFAVPVEQQDLRYFLHVGQKVHVFSECGEIKSVWVGSYKNVTSLTSIEDMKNFCYKRGIPQEVINNQELAMRKLYTSSGKCEDMNNACGVIGFVNQHGGVVMEKNNSWNVIFTTDNVSLFGVPLIGIHNLIPYLSRGQEVLVDVKDEKCTSLRIGIERTANTSSNFDRYLRELKDVPVNEIEILRNRFLQLREKEEAFPTSFEQCEPVIRAGTVIKFKRDSGKVMVENRCLPFKSYHFFVHGFCLANCDLRHLPHEHMEVSVRLACDVVDKVWFGSLDLSEINMMHWIKGNVADDESKHYLERQLGLTLGPISESRVNSLEAMDEGQLELWAPISDPSDEQKAVVVNKVQESHVSFEEDRNQATEAIQCDLGNDWSDVPLSIQQHLARFLRKKKLLHEDQQASEIVTAFVQEWKESFWNQWVEENAARVGNISESDSEMTRATAAKLYSHPQEDKKSSICNYCEIM